MRVLVLGAGGAHRTEISIVRAARTLGHQCRLINVPWWRRYARQLAPRIVHRLTDAFRPDVVILTRAAHALGLPIVQAITEGRGGGFWYFDLMLEPMADVLSLGRAAGAMFITCHSQLEVFRAAGVPQVYYLPQAMDSEADEPAATAPPEYRCDISFIGSGHWPYRHPVLRRVAEVGRMQVRGLGWDGVSGLPVVGGPVHGVEFARVVRRATISFDAHATPEQAGSCACASNRIWKILACEGFYLGPWQPGMAAFARDGEHCAWYRTNDEAVALARHYLARPKACAAIAAAGREHARRHHTYVQRVELLLARRSYPLDDPAGTAAGPVSGSATSAPVPMPRDERI